MKIFKNKKGLTLMELIVGMLMFAIIGLTISTSLAPTLMAYMRANDFAEYNTLLDNVANQIISDMTQAREVPQFEQGVWVEDVTRNLTIRMPTHNVTYTVDNGVLQRSRGGEPAPVFAEDFYKRKDVSFMLTGTGNAASPTSLSLFTLTVRLTERVNVGNTPFELEREYAVRPLMLNQT